MTYYVYILASRSRNLYIGVTNDIERRVYEHKKKLVPGFTTKYNIDRLVYFETTQDVEVAISREKQIKGWLRTKKISLIESMNPTWDDLSARWFEEGNVVARSSHRISEHLRDEPRKQSKADPSLSAQDDKNKIPTLTNK